MAKLARYREEAGSTGDFEIHVISTDAYTADGIKRSKAVAQVARATGVDRHDLYDAAQNALTTDKEES